MMKKMRNDDKGISPVLAVLLMIAVAVAAALITYAWVMTYLSSTTSRAGHAIQIQSVAFTGSQVIVYAQNVGDGTIKMTDIYLDGALKDGGFVGQLLETDGTTLEGHTTTITVLSQSFESAQEVDIKVVCDDGTFTSGTYTVELPGA